jgi:hypothetical protein
VDISEEAYSNPKIIILTVINSKGKKDRYAVKIGKPNKLKCLGAIKPKGRLCEIVQDLSERTEYLELFYYMFN